MLRRLLPIGFILVLLFGPSMTPQAGDGSTLLATANAAPVTMEQERRDLVLTVSASPDPVQPGQTLTYVVTVRNDGDVATPQASLTGQVPVGTVVEMLPIGCAEDSTTHALRCLVVPLNRGQQATFQITLRVTTASSSIPNRFVVDPENLVAEINESNNNVDRVVSVTPAPPTVMPSVVPTSTPAGVSAAPTVVLPPAPPVESFTPAPEPPVQATEPSAAQLWLEVLEPTEVWSDDGDLLWIAEPGEWYWVLVQDGDWVLGVAEDDPPDESAWIAIDDRVALAVF